MNRARRYTARIDPREVNDAHVLALGRVPARSTVLDLGAADGSMAAVLRGMDCRVWGVEIDQGSADVAREVCEEVLVEDLNVLDVQSRFGDQRFDVILMLDVLEHLQNPVDVLQRFSSALAPKGWVVISLPNMAHISVRLSLLKGQFRYTDTGLLDRSHLRFFDRSGLDDLLEEAGWKMFHFARVTRRLGTTEIQVHDADPQLVAQLEADIEALTYQFVFCAAPIASPVHEDPPMLPAAVVQDELLRARAVVQDELLRATARIAELDAEVAALRRVHLPDLWQQLSEIRSSGTIRRQHLQHLLAAVRENAVRLGAQPD